MCVHVCESPTNAQTGERKTPNKTNKPPSPLLSNDSLKWSPSGPLCSRGVFFLFSILVFCPLLVVTWGVQPWIFLFTALWSAAWVGRSVHVSFLVSQSPSFVTAASPLGRRFPLSRRVLDQQHRFHFSVLAYDTSEEYNTQVNTKTHLGSWFWTYRVMFGSI